MTVIPTPPEGYEVLPTPEDEAVQPEQVRFRAPDGEVVTAGDLALVGLLDLA